MEWKWTKGEPYEKSRRIPNKVNTNEDLSNNIDTNSNFLNKTNEDLAYSCSLNHDENTWEILNQSFNGFRQENKRADTDKRLSERQMVSQINMNPYLMNNNYVDDIQAHSDFMKPQSSSYNKEKYNETE